MIMCACLWGGGVGGGVVVDRPSMCLITRFF